MDTGDNQRHILHHGHRHILRKRKNPFFSSARASVDFRLRRNGRYEDQAQLMRRLFGVFRWATLPLMSGLLVQFGDKGTSDRLVRLGRWRGSGHQQGLE